MSNSLNISNPYFASAPDVPTPYRVFNPQACHGCWNDINIKFEHEYMWCPRHKNTPRMFECTRLITGRMVISKIRQLIKDHLWITPNGIEL